jgi:precorrin-6B methylase 2
MNRIPPFSVLTHRATRGVGSFERFFYPKRGTTQIADLGARDGRFTIDLSIRCPRSNVWALGSSPLSLPHTTQREGRLIVASGIPLEQFLDLKVFQKPHLLFDSVYLMGVPRGALFGLVESALQMIHPDGRLLALVHSSEPLQETLSLLNSAGFKLEEEEFAKRTVPRSVAARFRSRLSRRLIGIRAISDKKGRTEAPGR